MIAVVTVLVGAIGLIIGWFVSGYQKITEKLTEERRRAYLVLICEADKANENPKADRTALERAASDAEFICSNQMMKSGRIEGLVRAVATKRWGDERERFFKLARYESLNNSQWGRRLRWRDYGRAAAPVPVDDQSHTVTRRHPAPLGRRGTAPDRADSQGWQDDSLIALRQALGVCGLLT